MENILLYEIIFIGIVFILLIVLITLNIKLKRKIKKLLKGKEMISLESIILENNEISKKLMLQYKENQIEINKIKEKIKQNIRNISVIRFDALKNSGGLQSFSIGLIDDNKNGVVISSMYTRDRTNIFAKKITEGKSEQKLTDEEKRAIGV